MTSKLYYIFFLLIFTLTAKASPALPLMRSTFGFEYITPGISPEYDYKTTMVSLSTEFKLKHNINLIASAAFQEKGIPEGVEFKTVSGACNGSDAVNSIAYRGLNEIFVAVAA